MAKQHDDRPERPDEPKKPPRKKPEDFDELEVVEEAEEAEPLEVIEELEVVEEPPKPGQPPRKAPPTRVAGKPGQPTMLGKQEPHELPKPEGEVPNLSLEPHEVMDYAEIAEEPPRPPAKPGGKKTETKKPEPPTSEMEVPPDLLAEDVLEPSGMRSPESPPPGPPKKEPATPKMPRTDKTGGDAATSRDELDFEVKPPSRVTTPESAETIASKRGQGYQDVSEKDLLEQDKTESAVPLGEMTSKGERPSGVDEIAEALESGKDLGRKPPESPPPAVPTEDEAAAMLEEAKAPDSSGVGVGKTPPAGKKSPKEASDSDIFSDSSGEIEALADVPRSPIPKRSTVKDKSTKIAAAAETGELDALDEAAPADTGKGRGAADVDELEAAAEEEERPRDKKAAKPAKPAKPKVGRYIVVGVFVGLLVLAGALFAVSQFLPDLFFKSLMPALAGSSYEIVPKPDYTKIKGRADQADMLQAKAAEVPELKEQLNKSQATEKAAAEKAANAQKALATNQLNQKALEAKLKQAEQATQAFAAEKAKFEETRKQAEAALAAVAEIDKALAVANIKESGKEGLAKLVTAFADLDQKVKSVDKTLTDAQIKEPGAKGVQELIAAREKLDKERQALDQAIRTAHKELVEGNLVPPDGDPAKQIVQGLKAARQKAESPLVLTLGRAATMLGNLGTGAVGLLQRGFDNAGMAAELAFYRMREPFLEQPGQKLDIWLSLLGDRSRREAKDLTVAIREADWVLSKESRADAETRAKALFVRGLALRNQDKYAEAKTALDQAVKESAGLKGAGPWSKSAKQALAELSDARTYYLPRIQRLQESGDWKAALGELDAALKVMPKDGRLLAQRASVRLEMAGEKVGADEANKVRADAQAAQKDATAAGEAAYVLGVLEERLGNMAQAEQFLRQALKAPGSAEEQNRYRIALARLLLRDRPAAAPAAAPAAPPKGGAVGRLPEDEEEEIDFSDPRAALMIMIVTGVQPGAAPQELDAAAEARIKESIKLAEELIQSKNPKDRAQGYIIRGTALSKQGLRTEGLREFAKGIELLMPGPAGRDLSVLLREHPALMQPSEAMRPNPLLAEQHYGEGLHLYWKGKYPEAEKHFESALGFFGEDARYWYFVGLARLAQPGKVKRDAAYYAFEEGARREAAGRPMLPEINASLERIQGPLRQFVNSFREKALASAR